MEWGGARGPGDLAAALRAGADAVLAAAIFHQGEWAVEAVKSILAQEGWEMRV